MTQRRLALSLLGVLLACAGDQEVESAEVVQITIPRGATLAAAAESLHAHDLIASPRMFQFYAVASGRERAIQAGTYDLPRNASVREVLGMLVAGRPAEQRVVILEGLTLAELADTVEKQIGIPADSILAEAASSGLRERLGVTAPTLEGYLYPSTHLVRADATAKDVVQQLALEFERQWSQEWDARLDSLGMTKHQIVTLASIIEGEVRHEADRKYVSSVYHNRLRRGMRLQADPTVVFALGQRRRLYERDYQTPSPYNTYLIDGLPPGPIGSPTAASLEAALYPARSQFLYFVARPDGQHVFSQTYAEHLRAIREIRTGG